MIELPELVTPPSVPTVQGNFDEYLDKLKVLEQYKEMPLTVANKNTFMAIKKSLVSLRTLVTARKKEYIDSTVKVFKSQIDLRFDTILDYIAEIENHFDDELDKEEQKRVSEVVDTLDMFSKQFEAQYGVELTVPYPKKFFNKTQAIEDSYKELEQMFIERKKEDDMCKANEELIRKECGSLLPADTYIKMLEHWDITSILENIHKHKEHMTSVPKPEQKSAKKSLKVLLTYDESQSKLLNEFFKEHNIKVEVLS